MVKVILNFTQGSFEKGFQATLEIRERDRISTGEGQLPPQPILLRLYETWQEIFNNYLKEEEEIVKEKARPLREHLNNWLNSELFSPIKSKLTEILRSSEEVRLLVQAENYELWRLPWEQWDFLANYPELEIALSSPASKSIKRCTLNKPKTKIRILCIEGNIKGNKGELDTKDEIETLKSLFQDNADIELRQQPTRKELSRCFRDENGWDIIFFAGHSSTDSQQKGRIELNEKESLTIPELKYALRAAIALGLKLAIFNSCEGLGLAKNLADLQIPSVVVMREPVPNEVAQVFVKKFLEGFANNESLSASVGEARKSLKEIEERYPCASWLPVICQNPADEEISYQGLLSGQNPETTWDGACRTLLTLDAIKRLESNMLTKKKGLEIDDIYVPPNLGLFKRFKDKDSQQLSEQEKAQQKLEAQFPDTYKQEDFLVKVLQRGRSPYSQGRRIAIIGEPGTGKSLFLQRIGEWILWESDTTNQIVIWVSLADLRKKQNLEDYLRTNWLNKAEQQVNLSLNPKASLVEAFTSGRVLLLLDGVDEMPLRSGNPLAELTRQIANSELVARAKIILTCRVNVWEANQVTLQNFDVYRQLDFSYIAKYGRTIDQVERFIDGWFAGNEEDKRKGKALRQALEQEGKQQIKDLAKNPLRLSLLCGVWEERWELPETRETLPETKAELYKQFVEDIYKWKQGSLPVDESKRESLNKNLAELAKRALDQNLQGFIKKVIQSDQERELSLVTESLLSDLAEIGWEPQESPFRIPHLLAFRTLATDLELVLDLGWLTQVGVSKNNPLARVYTFFHPIFHEYFAAQAIAFNEWDYFLTHDNSFISHPAYGTYRVFEQQWREVILLWFGRRSEDIYDVRYKEMFIEALLKFEDRCRGFYSFQAQLLAAAALGEFKNCNDELAGQIIHEMMDSCFVYYINESNYSLPLGGERRRAYTALLQTDGSKAKEPLLNLLREIPKDYIGTLSDITNVIIKFQPRNQEAINAKLDLMLSDVDELKHIEMSYFSKIKICEIARGNAEAIKRLKRRLGKMQDEYKSKMATAALAVIASSKIPNEPNVDVFRIAKKAIENLVETLYTSSSQYLLHDQHFENVALESVDIKVSEQVIEKLTYLLETRKYKNLPWLTPSQMLNIPWYEQSDSPPAKRYAFTKYQEIRLYAARSLFIINPNNQEAVNTLVELLMQIGRDCPLINCESIDVIISEEAVEVFEKFGVYNQIVISALSACVANTENDTALQIAADTLGKVAIGTNDEGAIEALITRIHKTEDLWRRKQLAEILGKIQPGHPEALKVLTELINHSLTNNAQLDSLIPQAAKVLGIIDPHNIYAIETLIDEQQSALNKLNYFLEQLGISYENAYDSLSEMFSDSCKIDRKSARTNFLREAYLTHPRLTFSIKSLGELTYSNAKAINNLTNLLNYPEEEVRYEAAMSLLKVDPGNASAINTLINLHRHGQKELYQDSAGSAFPSFAKQVTKLTDLQRRENLISAVTEIMQTHPKPGLRYNTATALSEVDPGNEQVVDTLLDLLQNYPDVNSMKVVEALKKTLQGNQLQRIVRDLRDVLEDTHAKKYNDKNTSKLFEGYYELFCHCAENMSYPEFYKAFHREFDFSYLKPKLLLGRLVYLLTCAFISCKYYVSSRLKYPYFIFFDLFKLLRICGRCLLYTFIVLFLPLLIIGLVIQSIFIPSLRSQAAYILKLFWLFVSRTLYLPVEIISRLILMTKGKRW